MLILLGRVISLPTSHLFRESNFCIRHKLIPFWIEFRTKDGYDMKLINRRGRSSLPQSAEVTVSVIHQYSDHVHNRNNVSHVMLHNHNKYVILYPMQESENGTARQCPNPTDTCYQTIQMNPEGDGFMIRKGCMNLVRYDITLLPDDFGFSDHLGITCAS